MKLRFLGSGGYLRIPRACCNCRICEEAREKGSPYERLGQSLFIEDENILFDTPEDINTELNKHNIENIEHLFYSHWHPDHTAGNRILETLREGKDLDPVKVYLNENLKKDFENKVSALFFFEKMGYCKINETNDVWIGEINIEFIKLNNDFAYAFLIRKDDRKIVFCPCHSNDLPIDPRLKDCDLLVLNVGSFENDKEKITGFEKDNIPLIKEVNPKQTIFTHIEEKWNKNYDEYCKLEKEYESLNIKFAYDGMVIEV